MSRDTIITPCMDGGVSQQPPDQRGENQVEAASNVVFDLGFGFHRRPGSRLDRAFTEDAGRDLRTLPWDCGDQQYMVVYGRGASAPKLRIFQVGGNECSITGFSGGNDGYDYIDSNSATGMQIRPRRIEDYVLWVNTTVATGTTTSAAYSVERVRSDYDSVISYTTTDGYYVKSEVDDERATAGHWRYGVGTLTYGHINLPTITNAWAIHYGYWDDATYGEACGFRVAFRRSTLTGFTGATFTTSTGAITKTGAFSSYTWQQGDMIYVSAGTGFTAGWFRITGKDGTFPNDTIYITGGPGADNADTAANVTAAAYGETNICRIGMEVEAVVNTKSAIEDGKITDMHGIALAFQKAMRDAGAPNALCAWVPQTTGGGAFQITGPWRGGPGVVYAPTSPQATGLSANGDLTDGAGDPFYGTGVDVHVGSGSVGFSSPTETPESRWTRVAAPSQASAAIDATKMPAKLTRSSTTTFAFGADVFDERATGDSGSNPAPPLFADGKKIYDVAHWTARRVYAGEGGRLAFSESGDHENFFLDNAANVVDSDPFNRTLPSAGASYVQFLVPFRHALVVFTSQESIYELAFSETLTNANASLTPSASVRSQEIFPAPLSGYVYFLGTAGDYTRLREYFYDDLRVSSEAGDVTLQVPRYVPSPARSLAASNTHSVIFILPDDGNDVYVHFFRYNGQAATGGGKLMSSWSKWEFDAGYRICDISVLRDDLWMLVENTTTVTTAAGSPTTVTSFGHGLSNGNTVVFDNATIAGLNGSFVISNVTTDTFTVAVDTAALGAGEARMCLGLYTLEKIALYRPEPGTGYPYAIHLDRQVELTGVHSAGTTTWTLPATPTVLAGSSQFPGKGSTINVGVEGAGFTTPGTQIDTFATYTATTITKAGNYGAGPVTLGRYFTSSVQVTRPFARTQDGKAIAADPLTIERVATTHSTAGTYEIAIDPDYTSEALATRTMIAPYTPDAFGFLVSGTGLKSDISTIVIRTPALCPHPLSISQVRFDGRFEPTGIVTR